MPNALARERSPYLLQHKDNPVDWQPWGEAAFAEARERDVPIFLSIGYSTCHWCHVMEHESFEDETTAELINRHFVNVKVDREERPDVDMTYMAFVQATTGSGGWPMSVFLTPDLLPFLGGTYFPPEDRGGRASFSRVCLRVAELWQDDRTNLIASGQKVIDQLRSRSESAPTNSGSNNEPGTIFGNAFDAFDAIFDKELGGFSSAPKFPRPVTFDLLFRLGSYLDHNSTARARGMAVKTLDEMANGGIHDHIGGGFHRYSVDPFWHVPHFEKMLYDQAQLAISYLEAYQITEDQHHATTARGVLDYVLRDLTHPEGGFYCAEDADSLVPGSDSDHKEEGAFYTWTMGEIGQNLGEDADLFAYAYGCEETGNARPESDPQGEFKGKNTLFRAHTDHELASEFGLPIEIISDTLTRCRKKMLAARNKRNRPHLDDKIVTAWNGLMISALAQGARILNEPRYRTAAENAATFIQSQLWNGTNLLRSFRETPSDIPGFANDYAFLISGVLDLYTVSGQSSYLDWAIKLQSSMDAHYLDTTEGGYFSTIEGKNHAILSLKEDYDGAEPSPSSIATINLLRLAALTENETLLAQAQAALGSATHSIQSTPISSPKWLVALDLSRAPHQLLSLSGGADSPLAHAAALHFSPHLHLLHQNADAPPSATLCKHETCLPLITDPEELSSLLRG